MDEIQEVFPNAKRKGKLIVATNWGVNMKVLKESFDSIYERVDDMIADIMPGIINKAMNLAKNES